MKKLVIALAVMMFLGIGHANAAILTFDDIATDDWGFIPNGYGGLNWDNMGYVDKTVWSLYNSVSGNYSAYNDEGTPAMVLTAQNSEFFNVSNLYMGTLYNDTTVTLEAYRGNSLVYNDEFAFNQGNNMSFFDLNYNHIDSLILSSSKRDLMIDDMNVTPAPEPTSVALGLLGMGGLFGIRRRKS